MTMRRDVHDELRARLHEAAGAHEPDRERMLARIERGMTAPAGRPDRRVARPAGLGWLRVAGATAAVAGVLTAGGLAVASAVQDDGAPEQRQVAVSPTTTPSGSPAPSPEATSRPPAPPVNPSPDSSHPDREGSPPPATKTARPPAAGVEDGPLWSDGSVDPHSNDYWAQSNVTLKTSTRLTALTVRLRIAQTGEVSSAGAWRSLPEDDFHLTVDEEDGFLVYTWTLKEGRTVPPGEWMFAAQYDHRRGGRDAGSDSYTVTATAGSEQLTVSGDFAAQGDGDS